MCLCLWSLRLFTLGFISAVAMAGIIEISITESRITVVACSLMFENGLNYLCDLDALSIPHRFHFQLRLHTSVIDNAILSKQFMRSKFMHPAEDYH